MDINICPACGAVYKPKSTDCSNCGAVQARAASTLISTMAGAVAPMVVSVAPDRLILERIVTGRQLNALAPSNYFGDSDSYGTDDFAAEFLETFGGTSSGSDDEMIAAQRSNQRQEEGQSQDFFGSESKVGGAALLGTLGGVAAAAAGGDFFAGAAATNQELAGVAPARSENPVEVFVPEPEEREEDAFDTQNLKALKMDPEEEQSSAPPDFANFSPAKAENITESPFVAELKEKTRIEQPEASKLKEHAAEPAPAPVAAPAQNARPQVAGPAENRPRVEKAENSTYKVPTPATAEAFDFFQAGSTNQVRTSSKPLRESAERASSDDPHSSFESLLSKSSKSGNYKTSSHELREQEDSDDSHERVALKTANKKIKLVEERDSYSDDSDDSEDEDDRDDDERRRPTKSSSAKSKKVQPKSVIKKNRRSESDDDDDDNDDDDDDETAEEKAIPARRSFSGDPSSLKPAQRPAAKKASRPAAVRKSRRNEDDDDDDDEKSNLREKFQGGSFSIGGFPVDIKVIAVSLGVLGLFAFAIFHIVGNFSTLLKAPQTAGAGQPGLGNPLGGLVAEAPKVSGHWVLNAFQNGNSYPNIIEIRQKGAELDGIGVDQKVGRFSLKGNLTMENGQPVMQFKKQFLDANKRPLGPPIFFRGQLFLERIPLTAAGQWQFKKVSPRGRFGLNRQEPQMVNGEWQAMLQKPIEPEQGGTISQLPSMGIGGSGSGAAPEDGGKFNIITFMMKNGLIVAIGAGIAFITGTFTLFGPNGLINIWNKQQYIPSQVKAQHNKIKAQLAKPVKKGSLPLGQRVEWKWWFPMPWVVKDLAIPPDLRKVNPHVLILGQGGKGKSRLVAKMLATDIEAEDRAVVVVDSDGSLVDLMIAWISAHPRGREMAKRVILIDPTYKKGGFAYNPLNLPDMGDLQTAAASIVDGFKAIYTEPPGSQSQWNAQTADILRNAILLLIGNNKTLIDLPTLLNENDFRDVLLENIEKKKNQRVEFSTLLDQWGRYKKLARTDQWITWVEPILNRVNPMLSNPRIRAILTKPQGDLDIMDVVTKKKILFVRIPQGDFGQDANLLGSLIVSGVKQACLTLSTTGNKQSHNPVSLYLDNFDNFIEKNTIEAITSETKKFKIGLIAVTKSLQHLPEDFRNQLIINIGTLCTFALSKKDGDLLGPQMFPIDGRKVKHQTMSNIFNPVNTAPQFELVSDEEKLNIDKIVRQEERTFFCYRMGAEAGLFNLKSHTFDDIPESKIKKKLIDKMHAGASKRSESSDNGDD